MKEKISEIEKEALALITEAGDAKSLNELRIKYLGRNGIVADILSSLSKAAPEERPEAGKLANALKNRITEELRAKEEVLKKSGVSQLLSKSAKRSGASPSGDKIDITLPGIRNELGSRHPLTKTIDEISEIFLRQGFSLVEGPEIETEYYNFEALNIPLEHPSRDAFDTFYLMGTFTVGDSPLQGQSPSSQPTGKLLLRSQTSTMQIRVMEKHKPPLKIIAAGKVYRPDAVDASHSFMFHQLEGFLVDENVSFAELKGALYLFVKEFFGEGVKMRFRPHYFPFTEPSAEVDISCIICGGKGCSVCGRKGWLEILGCGMVNPNVFKAVGYDTKKYNGYAFGLGIERIAMLKYGINDIRLFFENDLRFLRQF